MKHFILLLFSVIFVSSSFAQTQTGTTAKSRSYLVGPGDKIVGKVMGENEFNFEVVIDDDGRFELPFVDKVVMAKCRTERDIKEEVKTHYSRFLRNPLISVQVTERRKPVPITVSGEVQKQLQVELKSSRKPTLFELLTLAGGQKESAGGIVRVFRTGIEICSDDKTAKDWELESNNGNTLPSRMFRLSSIKAGLKDSNPTINPGDLVVVEKASPVYFVGQVVKSDGIYIKEGGLSLTQAIAMVGGTRAKAKTKEVKIYRLKGESPLDRDAIIVDLESIKKGEAEDVMLQPYDIIDIERKKKSMAQTVLEVVTGVGRSAARTVVTGGANRVIY